MDIAERLLRVSLIGAHSNFSQHGFRQKDVRFIAELFTNWMDVFLKPALPQWHNTQALRFLEKGVKEGQVTFSGSSKSKRYRLTRAGLLQNTVKLVESQGYCEISHVILTYYFIRSYQKRIALLIQEEGSGFSKALQMEVEHLFDFNRYLEKQIDELKRQIQRLRIRIDETINSAKLATKLSRQGETIDRIIDQVALSHPYELENQKPMAELLKEIQPEIRKWEIIEGNHYRAEVLWKTQLQILEMNLDVLRDLQQK